jgi:hypothetical protein
MTDLELQSWQEQWQSEPSIPTNLRKSVERQSRLMRIGLLGDVAVTLVIGGGSIAWAMRAGNAEFVPVAIAAWVFLASAWIFVLMANRGLWSPSAMESSAFIDLSIRRCRRTLATLWFAVALFFAEVTFGLGWAYLHSVDGGRVSLTAWLLFSSLRVDVVWLVTALFLGGVVWYRRRKQDELARLLELRHQMSGPNFENGFDDGSIFERRGWGFYGSRRKHRGKPDRSV